MTSERAANIAAVAASVAAVGTATIGILFAVDPALRPKQPPQQLAATIEPVIVDSWMSLGDFLQVDGGRGRWQADIKPRLERQFPDRASFRRALADLLRERGLAVYARVHVQGYKDFAKLQAVRAQLLDERSHRPVPSQIALLPGGSTPGQPFRPRAVNDQGVEDFWAGCARGRRYLVRFELPDDTARVVAVAQTRAVRCGPR